MGDKYVYDALISSEHIRVVVLAPSRDDDAALECSIDQQHIDDKIYDAISYTWGNQERSQRLICDGATVNITSNLASALLCLRSRFIPRRLWADAICINQDDLDEKSQQIALMSTIFRCATFVRVWLGNGQEGESEALDDLASVANTAGPTKSGADQTYLNLGRSVKKIFRMPWFGRRWIVQELVLNETVVFHCGKSIISWPMLHFAVHALPDGVWEDDFDFQTRRKLRQFGQLWKAWCFAPGSAIECGIYSLLASFHDLQCKEVKDTVYAIAGLADDVELELQSPTSPDRGAWITPDYNPMVSDKDVFQDLAFKMIKSGKVLDTLKHAGASGSTEVEQPLASWIPDLRQPGPWPLNVRERQNEFKLIEISEPSNGMLTLKMEVYGWQRWQDPPPDEKFHIPEFGPTRSHLDHSMPDWHPIYVEYVFDPSKDQIAQDGHKFIQDIIDWLRHHISRSFDPSSPVVKFTNGVGTSHDLAEPNYLLPILEFHSMLWYLVQSQLLTEEGDESFDRLPSIKFLDRYTIKQEHQVGGQWICYLIKALSTRTIYIGQWTARHKRCFGFGPRGLDPCDAIFFPSSCSQFATTLFLRPAGSEYKVLGTGLAWTWPNSMPEERFLPREIEVRLI